MGGPGVPKSDDFDGVLSKFGYNPPTTEKARWQAGFRRREELARRPLWTGKNLKLGRKKKMKHALLLIAFFLAVQTAKADSVTFGDFNNLVVVGGNNLTTIAGNLPGSPATTSVTLAAPGGATFSSSSLS